MIKGLIHRAKVRKHKARVVALDRERCYTAPSKVRSCLILRSTFMDSDECVNLLKDMYPNIEFIELWHISQGTIMPSGIDETMTISRDNLTKRGFENAEGAVKLLNGKFDWFIDLSADNSDFVELLLLSSMAKCKISWRYIGDFVADITLKDVDNRKEFVERLPELFAMLTAS